MKTLKAYLELIRYPLFAIPIVATLPGTLIASEGRINWRVGVTLLTALIGYFAGMMKNDYFHRGQDAVVNPHRPTSVTPTNAPAGTDYGEHYLHRLRYSRICAPLQSRATRDFPSDDFPLLQRHFQGARSLGKHQSTGWHWVAKRIWCASR